MIGLAIPGTVYARIYSGMWIVDCHVCRSALAIDVGTTMAGCWDCGETLNPIAWPADPTAIELILSYRRVRHTRNWMPGETLDQLLEENTAHGIIPPQWLTLAQAAPGGALSILQTVGGVITGGLLLDALPASRPRHEIGV